MEKSFLAHAEAILKSDFTGLMTTKDRRIIWANNALHHMLGYYPGELIGQPTRVIFVDTASYDAFVDEVVAALRGKTSYSGLNARRRKDGTTGWYQCNIAQVVGQPDVYVGSFIDETSRHKMQEELELHRLVVQDQTELISRFLPDRTFSFVNDVFCRLFGKRREELVGFDWQPVVHPDDLAMVYAELETMTVTNPVVLIENRVKVATGEWRWFQFVNRGLYGPDGALHEVQSVGRDITAQKHAEQRLRESEERLKLALLGSAMVLWDWDVTDHKVTPGDRWIDILGYSDQELGVAEDQWMALVHPADLKAFMERIYAHLQGDSAQFESEHRLKHKDGHWVHVQAFGKVSARDNAGNPVRMIGTIQDISHRKRLSEVGLDLLRKVELLIKSNVPEPAMPHDALDSLTKRERQILRLIAEGLTSGQIAHKLDVATNTVISHRQKMMTKLNLHSTAEVIRFALENASGLR